MSADNNNEAEEEISRCASCGTTENDDIKLRICTDCYLVRYCGVQCQKDHRMKHEKECKKRAAELRDELLFKQPESSHEGDCPICCIPLPLVAEDSGMMPCCSKLICIGCDYSYQMRQPDERLGNECPFCRHPILSTKGEAEKILMKRVEANDPVAVRQMGKQRYDERDYKAAFKYWSKAAELGDVLSHFNLSNLYSNGEGVEKDEKKDVYHLEQAVIGGQVDARHDLGCVEWNNGRHERALRHWIIAANLGHDNSLEAIKRGHRDGLVSKDDFASTLRAHKAAVDAMKSPQREAAEADVQYSEFRQKAKRS